MNDIINKEELLDEIDGDWEFLEESVEMLIEDAPALISEIKAGQNNNDAESIWKNAHTLKSMVGNFSAIGAFAAAYLVESLGRNGELANIDEAISNLVLEIDQLISALKELLKNK